MALNGTCWAARFAATSSGANSTSDRPATARQRRAKNPFPMHMTADTSPKASMARLTTSEPKCAQDPTEKIRMMQICSAITAPATRPTPR